MNKSTTNLSRVEVRDSDKGEILESFILNSDGTPYDLSGKSLVFNENKDGDKFVSDPNVTIVDARIGHITYQLHDQVHSARGTAWFDVIDKSNGAKIDSTTDFYIEVRDGLKCTVYNTTYISDLEKLKQQMEALIRQADGELKTELQRAEQQLSQELQNFRNQYNSLSNDFQNQFKSAQNARQADYNNQKEAINADWFNTKNNINKNALDTINAIKDNAKQVLDRDQADWNAKQTQWDSTFSAIVKEWQVKTNSLNATVQDLTNKFNTIIGQVSDLMNNKLPTINAKTDAIQAKVNELRASLSQIDWTTFAKDLELKKWIIQSEPGWNQLNSNMTQWEQSNEMVKAAQVSYNDATRMSSYDYTGGAGVEWSKLDVSGLIPNTVYRLFFEWENPKQLSRIAGDDYKFRVSVYDKNNQNNVLAYQDLPADPCNKKMFCLTFDTNNVTDVYIELNTGGLTDGLHFTWQIGNWLLKPIQEHVPIVAIKNNTDLNTIKTPGMYHAMGTDGIANSPIPAWFDLTVNSDNMYNGTQMLHVENENQVYVRSWHSGNTFTDWQRITNATDLATRLPVSGGNMNKGSWITWSGRGDISATDGHLGGLQWTGATDSIQIYGDNNAADNLDLAIQLGDDNSNHISFRRANGDEVAAINLDGRYTGTIDWNRVNGRPDINNANPAVTVINSFDVANVREGTHQTWPVKQPWLVDQAALHPFAEAINSLKGQGTYRINNAVDVNTLTGNVNQVTTYILTNSGNKNAPVSMVNPSMNDPRGTLIVFNYDGNVKTQLWIPVGTSGRDMGFAWRYWEGDNVPGWHIFYDAITSIRSSVGDIRSEMRAQMMVQDKVNKRVDYESPSGTITNDTVNFNDYRETGILKVVNCLIQNGPYKTDNRHTIFLKVTNLDGQTQYQTVYEGDDLYGRKLYNGSGQWHKYTNTPI